MVLESLLILGICSLFQIAGLALMVLPSGSSGGRFVESSHKSKKTKETSHLLEDENGNVYTFKRANKSSKVWRCTMYQVKKCPAEVQTNLEVS